MNQKIKLAVIMAGGEGERLRPMTQTLPKPLMPVAGESAMSHILRLLDKHHIPNAIVTLGYRGELIREKYGEQYGGVHLRYSTEQTPLGTAGGVRSALEEHQFRWDEPVLVLSGDAVCDVDLSAAAARHFLGGAEGTILTAEVADPSPFGVIITEKEGKIIKFLEKPSPEIWKKLPSRQVNTGIYILSPSLLHKIPYGKPLDFGRDFFPACLAQGRHLCASPITGYWCDIGTAEAFYRCNFDAVQGKIGGIGANVSPDNSLIGACCHVSNRAEVKDSVLFDGVTIGSGCQIEGAILCDHVTIGKGVKIGKGAILGPGVTVGDDETVVPGAVMSAKDTPSAF